MGGGDQPYSAYQVLPTNLQNYTGGTGSPALMHQDQDQGAPASNWWGGYAPQISPYRSSPYGFMGGMGQNFGMPAPPATDYNAVAGAMAGPGVEPPNYAKKIKKARKKNDKIRKLKRQLENLRKKNAATTRHSGGGGGSDNSGGSAAGGEQGGDPTGGGGSGVDGR